MIPVLLMLAQTAIVSPVSISEVHASPRDFHGKRVMLEGWVNGCQPLSCHISEKLGRGSGDHRDSLSFDEDARLDEQLKPILPARIEIEATFDAGCLTTHICLDRAPMLRDVVVRKVLVQNQKLSGE